MQWSLRSLALTSLIALGLLLQADLRRPLFAQTDGAYRVLVFTRTMGFRHDSIPDGIAAIQNLGTVHGFAVDHTEDVLAFTDERLAAYRAVVFLSTTGDVLEPERQSAFERYIQHGGGFVGIHSATDTEYDWPWYGGLVGAYFASHPAIQPGMLHVADPTHSLTAALPDPWRRTDEWYNFRTNPRHADVQVLLTLDETSFAGGAMGADHPIAWSHGYDGGRAWYTAGGHTSETFSEPEFQAHLWSGIQYAGALPADGADGPIVITTAALAAADGGFIVYQCGDGYANLCRIQPDGSGQASLTSDGRRDGQFYASPSLSRDGARLAFNFANQTFVVDGDPPRRSAPVARAASIVALRPDGAWLATVETFPEQTMLPGLTGPTFFSTLTPYIITYNLATGERKQTSRLPGTLAWAGERIVSNDKEVAPKKQTLCLLKADNVSCERTLAQDNSRDLTDPAVSPDNSLLVTAGCTHANRTGCSLALYGMANGAKLRDLTAGPDDTAPAWSPDGTSIVFNRAGDLYVASANDGSLGSARLLVRGGRNPTWGGSSASIGPPPAPMPPPPPVSPEPAPAPPVLQPLPTEADAVQRAIGTAADQLQVAPERLIVVRVEPMEWSDASLGCPEPDRAYAQVIVPGYLVVLVTDDGAIEVQIHTDAGQRAVMC